MSRSIHQEYASRSQEQYGSGGEQSREERRENQSGVVDEGIIRELVEDYKDEEYRTWYEGLQEDSLLKLGIDSLIMNFPNHRLSQKHAGIFFTSPIPQERTIRESKQPPGAPRRRTKKSRLREPDPGVVDPRRRFGFDDDEDQGPPGAVGSGCFKMVRKKGYSNVHIKKRVKCPKKLKKMVKTMK